MGGPQPQTTPTTKQSTQPLDLEAANKASKDVESLKGTLSPEAKGEVATLRLARRQLAMYQETLNDPSLPADKKPTAELRLENAKLLYENELKAYQTKNPNADMAKLESDVLAKEDGLGKKIAVLRKTADEIRAARNPDELAIKKELFDARKEGILISRTQIDSASQSFADQARAAAAPVAPAPLNPEQLRQQAEQDQDRRRTTFAGMGSHLATRERVTQADDMLRKYLGDNYREAAAKMSSEELKQVLSVAVFNAKFDHEYYSRAARGEIHITPNSKPWLTDVDFDRKGNQVNKPAGSDVQDFMRIRPGSDPTIVNLLVNNCMDGKYSVPGATVSNDFNRIYEAGEEAWRKTQGFASSSKGASSNNQLLAEAEKIISGEMAGADNDRRKVVDHAGDMHASRYYRAFGPSTFCFGNGFGMMGRYPGWYGGSGSHVGVYVNIGRLWH